MNANEFIQRLIYHQQQGIISQDLLNSIIEAEKELGTNFQEMGNQNPKKKGSKSFVVGSLNVVAMFLVLSGLWFFFDLMDLSWDATEISFLVISGLIVSSMVYFWIRGASKTIMEVHSIFAIGFLVNSYFISEKLWEFLYLPDLESSAIFSWVLNLTTTLAIVVFFNYSAEKLDLDFSKIIAGLSFNLPLISMVIAASEWSRDSVIFPTILVLLIAFIYMYVFSNLNHAHGNVYATLRSAGIHESLIWAIWFIPFIFADAIVQDNSWRASPEEEFYHSIFMIFVIVSISALGLLSVNRKKQLNERNNNYYLAIFYALSFSWMPVIASIYMIEYLFGDDWTIHWIPPMILVYSLARIIVKGEPFTTKLPDDEKGKIWFNRTLLGLLILYFVCFIIDWLEEYAFYVFVPIGIFIAGYFIINSLKEDEQKIGKLQN